MESHSARNCALCGPGGYPRNSIDAHSTCVVRPANMFDVRRVLLGLFILVLASLIAALLLRGPTPEALRPPEIEAATAQAETPTGDAWSSDEVASRARTSVAAREPSSEATVARDESEPPPQLRELRGSYREFDPWGRDRAVETGSFRLKDERERPVTVAVEHGQWSTAVLGSAFEIGECTLEGDQLLRIVQGIHSKPEGLSPSWEGRKVPRGHPL